MDVESDPNLVVVNLEHCVSSEGAHLGKNSCIYTTTVPANSCHDMLQLATPVQCLNDINQSLSRLHQHQHLTQLQPLQYPQVQVNYDSASSAGLQHGSSILPSTSMYQSSAIHYSHPPSFLTSLPPQPLHILESAMAPDSSEHATIEIGLDALEGPVDECTHPSDDYSYYKEIENYLSKEEIPLKATEVYIKNLKARAKHYLIKDGVLHHNPKKPKRVVMTLEEQNYCLEKAHLVRSTGIHQGIKKMLSTLHEKYFWRGMYVAVANFVKECDCCRDTSIPLGSATTKDQLHEAGEENQTLSVKTQTFNQVWDEVEISVIGPFNITSARNEYIVTITDPSSCFVVGTPISQHGQCTKVTQFILHTFYTFGFPFSKVSVPTELFDAINSELNWCLKGKKLSVEKRMDEKAPWVSQLVSLLVKKHPANWDRELHRFLYQFRTGGMKQFGVDVHVSPFYAMFNRKHIREVLDQNKENVSSGNAKSSHSAGRPVWQCRKCSESFASRVSYRSHMKLHRKNIKVPETLQSTSGTTAIAETEKTSGVLEVCVKNTVSAVKAVLDGTKHERRKRGNYQKYSAHLQQEMADYASTHGSPRAAEYFSKLLGSQVSESTIRNIVKSYSQFTPSVKEDIAKYAVKHSVAQAASYFSKTLSRNITPNLVRNFKDLYLKESSDKAKCDSTVKQPLGDVKIKVNQELGLTPPPRDHQMVDIAQAFTSQPIPCQTTCFTQPTSIATLTQSSSGYSFQNMQVVTSTFAPSQQLRREDDNLIAQHFLLVTPDGPSSFELNVQPDKPDDKGGQLCLSEYHSFHVDPQIFIDACPESLSPKIDNTIHPVPDIAVLSTEPTPAPEIPPKPKKYQVNKKKRGTYCTYSPELRAKIGKYAAEHGCIKASNHFSEILGYDVAESTARALKQKYLQKVGNSDVTSLGFSQRGRPLRLGKYDKVVQECLIELFRSGEKVTSFLAITTAKEVLNKFEPELLEENGGPVVLNTSWAKSFLKRIGVRNNS